MYCERCGNRVSKDESFCTKCGIQLNNDEKIPDNPHIVIPEEKWWQRTLKVLYIGAYIPLLGIIPAVWSINQPYYSSYSRETHGSYGEALWYSVLTLIVYVGILRLIKIAVLYITTAKKPLWKLELKKFF